MSPDEFLNRTFAAADDAALFLAGMPADQQSAWLQKFGYSVHAQWLEVFAPYMSPRDIDGMMIDLMERIQRRRDYLQRFVAGNS
jgi:hypothetical protein